MREAFAFLTVLGWSRTPTPRAVRWFTVVGFTLGTALGAAWWLLDRAFPALVAAVLVVAVDLALTGLLHLDGLADTADGLLPHLSRERRLDVMRTPDIGAFAVGAVVVVLVTRTAALASRPPDILLVAGVWCTSRVVVAVAPAAMPYAREAGLASAFLGGTARWLPLTAIAPATVSVALGIGWPALAVVAATLAGGTAVLTVAHLRIGGFTGDVLGAAILVGETVGLVVATARW
jgi:adenosylcobinamide-GDP ribazoletransferase